ncbi:hypothetical protein CON64_10970 [Bacillus pseudomycoides]|nr:hypothetical protein CON64_10970 [Bacillus pseudomycoides]
MHRSGQGLFLPRAMFKTQGASEFRAWGILHNIDLDVVFLVEHLTLHRSGQGLFLPRAMFKQARSGHGVFCITLK